MPIRILPLSSLFLSSDKGGRGREGQGQRPIYEPSSVRAGAGGYRAPEVVGTRRPTLKADFYSLGVLLLELLTGKSPTPTSRLTPIFPPHASSRLCRGRCAPPPDLRPSNPPGNTTPPGSALSESRRLRQRWHTPPPGSNPVTGSSSSPSPAGESSRCSFD